MAPERKDLMIQFGVSDLDTVSLEKENVRVLLVPTSRTTKHSAGLKENTATVSLLSFRRTPDSPASSPAEEETEEESVVPVSKQASPKGKARRTREDKWPVFALTQNSDVARFSVGLSPTCDIVLKHRESDIETYCYINQKHAEFYPDPDTSATILHNTSTVAFTVTDLETDVRREVESFEDVVLSEGFHQLMMGAGLTFQIKIVLRPMHVSHGLTEIVPQQPLLSRQHIATTDCSSVYKSERSGQAVAVKVCRKGGSVKTSVKRWENEVDILSKLDHVSQLHRPSGRY